MPVGSSTGLAKGVVLVKKIKLIPREISQAHSPYCQIGNKLFDLLWLAAAAAKRRSIISSISGIGEIN